MKKYNANPYAPPKYDGVYRIIKDHQVYEYHYRSTAEGQLKYHRKYLQDMVTHLTRKVSVELVFMAWDFDHEEWFDISRETIQSD